MVIVSNSFSEHGAPSDRGIVNGRVGVRLGHRQIDIKRPRQMFRLATLNVGTMKGRSAEVVETISRRGFDLCCLQETRWRGGSARVIVGKDSKYKFFWLGNEQGTGGVGFLLAEKWVENVLEINRVSDRVCVIKINVGVSILTVVSVYAPQSGLDERTKDAFYDLLQCTVSKAADSECLFVCGDFNGHIGRESSAYDGVHGGFGYGKRNIEGERILEFSTANDFVICNSFFHKRYSHLVTYQSGGASTQVDYILTRKRHFKSLLNVKVIPYEECVSQHKRLVCDLALTSRKQRKPPFNPKLRVWKLKDPVAKVEFLREVKSVLKDSSSPPSVDGQWHRLRDSLLEVTEKICGFTKKGHLEEANMVVG